MLNFIEQFQRWNDGLLMWNSDDFGGVGAIAVPVTGIWSPDIKLYNR